MNYSLNGLLLNIGSKNYLKQVMQEEGIKLFTIWQKKVLFLNPYESVDDGNPTSQK